MPGNRKLAGMLCQAPSLVLCPQVHKQRHKSHRCRWGRSPATSHQQWAPHSLAFRNPRLGSRNWAPRRSFRVSLV